MRFSYCSECPKSTLDAGLAGRGQRIEIVAAESDGFCADRERLQDMAPTLDAAVHKRWPAAGRLTGIIRPTGGDRRCGRRSDRRAWLETDSHCRSLTSSSVRAIPCATSYPHAPPPGPVSAFRASNRGLPLRLS